MLPGWLAALGAEACTPQRVPDTAEALAAALAAAEADVVVTTGSTARGPVDHLHAVLAQAGARLLVDGVAVRPGHPMLLALLPDGRPLVGLPGNPLAAVSGLLTLAEPVLRALLRRAEPEPVLTTLRETVTGHPHDTRLVPVRDGVPLHHVGPAMLRGLVAADAMAVIPPHGGRAGSDVRLLRLPGA
jgi:molybdopterin molybdotransferase